MSADRGFAAVGTTRCARSARVSYEGSRAPRARRRGSGGHRKRAARRSRASTGRAPRRSMPRVHQRRDREPVVRDPRLLALVEIPALLAREAVARERGLGRVLELYVDHDDRGGEDALVRVLDGVGGVEDLLADHHVVDPYLPQLAAAVVHVRIRDAPRLLVDEYDTLAEVVLRDLGAALDHGEPALLPYSFERTVAPGLPLDRG